jgi:hypothetical protein
VSEQELTDAVAELYRVFARYPLRDDVSYCDHCIAPEVVAALHAVPLRPAVLAAWATIGGAASVHHLAALVSDLTTGSITDFEIRADIDAWICGPAPEAALTAAAGTPGPDAADAVEALEDLRWFREWYCTGS